MFHLEPPWTRKTPLDSKQEARFNPRHSKTFPDYSALALRWCVCGVSSPGGSVHHTYANVLALDIIISRFVFGASR